MNYIPWRNTKQLFAGTSLRDKDKPLQNNLALHTGADANMIIANRQAFAKEIGVDMKQWVLAQQTHSDHIQKVTMQDIGRGSLAYEQAFPDCDALYTKEKGILLGVFHADCVPILLYDNIQQIICAIHSGWIGTTKELTAKALHQLIEVEGCDPKNLHAYIGPAIAHQSFEVGKDVLDKLALMSFDTTPFITLKDNDKALVDNKGLNLQMLLNAGLLSHHITIDKNDTFLNNESFFSFRRNKSIGRHLSFIIQKP